MECLYDVLIIVAAVSLVSCLIIGFGFLIFED